LANILAVFAHSDDEVLGCGATLFKHAVAGDDIHILYLTRSITSRDKTKNLCDERKSVADYLSASYYVEDFPDQELDSVPQLWINQVIEDRIARVNPDLIYTHTVADANEDHVAVSKSVKVATKGKMPILRCEIRQLRPPPVPFIPTFYEDVAETINDKLQLMKFYSSELRDYPDPRSYRAIYFLAGTRGTERMMRFAEAFEEAY
jgi:N-acetylglucosamine malate deacetylase 1